MWAASENHAEVVTLLVSRGADVNARSAVVQFPKDRFGLEGVLTILPHGNWTPLMYAARDGGADAARVLAKAGADVNAADPDGTTPLILAIMNAHYDTANAILEAGADPNITDKAGMAALYAAVDMSSLGEVYGMPPRKVQDTLKPTDLISRLIAKGSVVDARLTSATLQRNHTPGEPQLGAGTTPLMRAARNGDYAAMKILLAAGADPTLKQPRGTTALMMASGLGRGLGVFAKDYGTEADLRQAVELLVERNVDVNASTDDGITAIHLAAQAGLDSVVRYSRSPARTSTRRTRRAEHLSTWRWASAVAAARADRHRFTIAQQSYSRNWVHLKCRFPLFASSSSLPSSSSLRVE